MNSRSSLLAPRQVLALVVSLWSAVVVAGSSITLTPDHSGAVYGVGEKIVWRIEVRGDAPVKEAHYVLRQGGATVIGQGNLTFNSGAGSLETSLNEPGTILAEVTAQDAGGQKLRALAGVVVAPERIKVSSPCPDDFDAFWQAKLKELASVPAHPVLEPGSSGKANVDYWKITMDNIRGTHIRGQLARPSQGGKRPAMLIVQWAGVYPLSKGWAVDRAAEGWLTLNILAHDLPIDEPQSFYDNQSKHALQNYTAIGNDDREQSYFLRMFLSCHRAVEYLSERPDWDGKTLIVTGTSQGGLQTFVTAGLNPKVTALLALVPAGCDNTGALAGRKPGWPYWMANVSRHDEKKTLETSRYFDAVNFAARIKCPALIGLGLIDTTSPPSGVFSAINQLRGPKEVVVMPNSEHREHNKSQAPFNERSTAWRAALLAGKPLPLQ